MWFICLESCSRIYCSTFWGLCLELRNTIFYKINGVGASARFEQTYCATFKVVPDVLGSFFVSDVGSWRFPCNLSVFCPEQLLQGAFCENRSYCRAGSNFLHFDRSESSWSVRSLGVHSSPVLASLTTRAGAAAAVKIFILSACATGFWNFENKCGFLDHVEARTLHNRVADHFRTIMLKKP